MLFLRWLALRWLCFLLTQYVNEMIGCLQSRSDRNGILCSVWGESSFNGLHSLVARLPFGWFDQSCCRYYGSCVAGVVMAR